MIITKKFRSLQQEYGYNIDYGGDKLKYQTEGLKKLLQLSHWDNQTKAFLSKKLSFPYINYFFPNSFFISNKAIGLYNIQKLKYLFGHICNKQIGYPFSNNDLQLLMFIEFTKNQNLSLSTSQGKKQFHYNQEVLKYWNNYSYYQHQKILNQNKLLLFCGCGSYGSEFMIRTKLIYDIITKYKNLVY